MRPRGSIGLWILGATSILFLALFGLLPLALVAQRALASGIGRWSAELLEPSHVESLLHSLVLGVSVCALAIPIGAGLAWILERTDAFETQRARSETAAILSVPLAIPPYLLGMAWLLIGNGRTGLVNRFDPWIDLYGLDGMVLVLATATYPFSLLSVRAALVRADPSLEEAARVSGASWLRVLLDVTLPLMRPAIASATGLVFMFTEAAFGVPYLFGGSSDAPYRVLTTRIYQDVTVGGSAGLESAAVSALALLTVSLGAQAFANRLGRRGSSVQIAGKVARASRVHLGALRAPVHAGVIGFAALFVILPMATIAWISLSKSPSELSTPSLEHWRSVLARHETLRAFLHSALLAVGAGALVVIMGTTLARIIHRQARAARVLSALASAPQALPGTVLAIGLILAFSREIRVILLDRVTLVLQLSGTLGILLVAYVVKALAFGVRGVQAALEQLHPVLEEAARTSGASEARSFRDVVLPLVAPAAGAAFLIVLFTSLSELTMSVLLFGARTETAGTLLFELQSYSDPPESAVVATIIIALAIALDQLARRLEKSRTEEEHA